MRADVSVDALIGARDDRITEIIEGVLPGELVVVSGNYQLQFVKDKSAIAAGGGHGHAHGPSGEHLTEEDQEAHGETKNGEVSTGPSAEPARDLTLLEKFTDSPFMIAMIALAAAFLVSLIMNGILFSRKATS